jgi:hypothetical protein
MRFVTGGTLSPAGNVRTFNMTLNSCTLCTSHYHNCERATFVTLRHRRVLIECANCRVPETRKIFANMRIHCCDPLRVQQRAGCGQLQLPARAGVASKAAAPLRHRGGVAAAAPLAEGLSQSQQTLQPATLSDMAIVSRRAAVALLTAAPALGAASSAGAVQGLTAGRVPGESPLCVSSLPAATRRPFAGTARPLFKV